MLLLKKIFNWFKLFLALDFMIVSIVMTASEYKQFSLGPDKWVPLLIAGFLLFSLGFLLLIWFIRVNRKFRKKQTGAAPSYLGSSFQYHNPKLSAFLDGWSFNGFGTKFFTYSNKQDDGSIYAIKWIILAYLPLAPLYQQKISIVSEKDKIRIPFFISSSSLKYTVQEKVRLNKRLIRLTFGFYYLFFLPALIAPLVLLLVFLKDLNSIFPASSFWWLLLIYLAWGIFLVFLTELFNKRFFLRSKIGTNL